MAKRRGKTTRRKANPELALILANPPERGADLMSRRVMQIEYAHVEEEGKDVVRFHPFGAGVQMWALEGGGILLKHKDGKPLWEEM